MNRGAWTRVENFDLSTTSVGGLYRFLGEVNQLDRGFEGLSRAGEYRNEKIAAQYRADGGKPPQTVSKHPNLNGTVGRVPPGATGAGRFDGPGPMDCPELLKAGLPG